MSGKIGAKPIDFAPAKNRHGRSDAQALLRFFAGAISLEDGGKRQFNLQPALTPALEGRCAD
jgi:hypothetical protein